MMQEEQQSVAIAMMNFGGGFAGRLGWAIMYADRYNALCIKAAFPELWVEYQDKARILKLQYPENYHKYQNLGAKRVKSGRF